MHILIANLDLSFTNEQLAELFSPYGTISKAEIAMDGFTGESRGFGYVEMENDDQGVVAISELNNKVVNDHKISVKETIPPQAKKGSYKVGNGAVNAYRFKK